MYLLLYMLLCTTSIFCADTPPQQKTTPKQMPAGLRHLEELQDLRNSQEYSEINDELKSVLPRTPASRRGDSVVFDPEQVTPALRAVIARIHDQNMVIDFSNDDAVE